MSVNTRCCGVLCCVVIIPSDIQELGITSARKFDRLRKVLMTASSVEEQPSWADPAAKLPNVFNVMTHVWEYGEALHDSKCGPAVIRACTKAPLNSNEREEVKKKVLQLISFATEDAGPALARDSHIGGRCHLSIVLETVAEYRARQHRPDSAKGSQGSAAAAGRKGSKGSAAAAVPKGSQGSAAAARPKGSPGSAAADGPSGSGPPKKKVKTTPLTTEETYNALVKTGREGLSPKLFWHTCAEVREIMEQLRKFREKMRASHEHCNALMEGLMGERGRSPIPIGDHPNPGHTAASAIRGPRTGHPKAKPKPVGWDGSINVHCKVCGKTYRLSGKSGHEASQYHKDAFKERTRREKERKNAAKSASPELPRDSASCQS